MSEEVNYKIKFMDNYYKSKYCDFDIDKVDIVVKNTKGKALLYIESKNYIFNDTDKRKALAQVILTNKQQKQSLTKVAVIYKDKENNDILIEIDCSDDSILYNNDINWKAEIPSNPKKDAINRINDRIKDHLKTFKNEEIKEYFVNLVEGESTEINITKNNFNTIYNEWKNEIKFNQIIEKEQDLINLFIVDILNNQGDKYKEEEEKDDLINIGFTIKDTRIDEFTIKNIDNEIYFSYDNGKNILSWVVSDIKIYNEFWRKYKRPPQRDEFIQILELHSKLYSDEYRKITGSEYTPSPFVELQNKKLKEFYNMDDFIVFDPCCGVGNLQNDFGKDYKNNCYMSTLEQMDVDVCKTKGFENVEKFDFLKDDTFPKFKYKGDYKNINEICDAEHKKLMIIMNPPYQKKGHKDNLAIEFFNKCLKLKPQVIVFYYMTESFLREEVHNYINSKYKIVSHVFSNAKDTFSLSEWPISMVIFDKDQGKEIDLSNIEAERYEVDKFSEKLVPKEIYHYNYTRPNLINEIDKKIKENSNGSVLGNFSYLKGTINLTNKVSVNSNKVTKNNLKYCLLSKGINFNTHNKYFERNQYVYKGKFEEIPNELYSDSICFSLFYLNCAFTNKGKKNYIMPFSANELGCNKNDLNVLFPEYNGDLFNQDIEEKPFDFREFLKDFTFSQEAKDLFNSALKIFKYYHNNNEYINKDWNDSFYDITNAIMGKDASDFKALDTDNDIRINKVRTTKGTKGFGRNTIKYAVSSEYLPIFIDFFNKRDILAKKINKQLVENGLLLWERENIY